MTARKQTARYLAMLILDRFDPQKTNAKALLEKFLPQTQQRQHATDLVLGTIRNRLAIDAVIVKSSDCPVSRISPRLINLVRIAAYELIFNPDTPSYAAVNEAVENARAVAGKKQTAFVNAVLRQITRNMKNPNAPLAQANAKCTLPRTAGTGCEFDFELLPDPAASPADHLAGAFSLPNWLVEDWLAQFGLENTRRICLASNRRPSIYLRPNPLKTNIDAFVEKLRQASIDFEITTDNAAIRLVSPHAVTELPGFKDGLFTVQDITAMLPAKALNPLKGWKILDVCAAPGTKTTQLAEITGDNAQIFATDIDSSRLEKVGENIKRLSLNCINLFSYADLDDIIGRFCPFDAVLLDVPCSNSGVLAKRPEVRYRITPAAVADLTAVQMQLLQKAAQAVKTGGFICYSTCSLQNAENSSLAADFLRQNPCFELKNEVLTLPRPDNFDCDGGYAAILKKTQKSA